MASRRRRRRGRKHKKNSPSPCVLPLQTLADVHPSTRPRTPFTPTNKQTSSSTHAPRRPHSTVDEKRMRRRDARSMAVYFRWKEMWILWSGNKKNWEGGLIFFCVLKRFSVINTKNIYLYSAHFNNCLRPTKR